MNTALTVEGEIRLMKAIIIQAIDDATVPLPSVELPAQKPGETDKKYDRRCRYRAEAYRQVERDRMSARRWLTGNSRDFQHICTWAELNPEYVIRKAKELAAAGWPHRISRTEVAKAA